MDALTISTEAKPKRMTGYARCKRQMGFMAKDLETLRCLANSLLDHLETATTESLTERDRARYRKMIEDIRDELLIR